MQIINGSELARAVKQGLREDNLKNGLRPVLAIIVVAGDEESLVYVGLKEKAVNEIGGVCRQIITSADITRDKLITLITELNNDETVDGILLQLPLPEGLQSSVEEILSAIDPEKDVDGFTPANRGLLSTDSQYFTSCAALGVFHVIKRIVADLKGKEIMLVGDSFDVVTPLAIMLMQAGSRVRMEPEYKPTLLGNVDVLVIEKGRPEIVKGEHLKQQLLLIDAGFYWENGRTLGNVDRSSVADNDGWLLPVPGGLGPMLIAMLMKNLCQAARQRNK
ncbi:MAG: bifunctional 5,10-methylenetetrahydrofolate dehydrogenase/5,10-methenyltetrahydrofolate cyclohydrolase [Deltaproteobacteria bacterium]